MSLPFSSAADRNKEAIGDALQPRLNSATTVFEFGSGTGQHALYLCQRYPHLIWQPSDLTDNLDAIGQRTGEQCNIPAPVAFDVLDNDVISGNGSDANNSSATRATETCATETRATDSCGNSNSAVNPAQYTFIYSANTAHIMSIDAVAAMIACASALLQSDGYFALYGPFRYGSQPMTDGNIRFDAMLRQQDAAMGIRDKFELDQLAQENGLAAVEDLTMPSNNRILIWQKAG